MIKLKENTIYHDGNGRPVTIIGPVRDWPNKPYYWSLQGDWYDPKTGDFISTSRDGTYKPLPEGSLRNLVTEIGPYPPSTYTR